MIISDSKIGFPAVRKCDILVAMTQESANSLLKDLKDTGILIVDATNVAKIPETEARVYALPITRTAKEDFGQAIYANMIMLGIFAAITGLISEKSFEHAIGSSVSAETTESNVNAFKRGLELVP